MRANKPYWTWREQNLLKKTRENKTTEKRKENTSEKKEKFTT